MNAHTRPSRLNIFARRLVSGLITPYFVLLAVGFFAVIANGMELPTAPPMDAMLWVIVSLTSVTLLLALAGYARPLLAWQCTF